MNIFRVEPIVYGVGQVSWTSNTGVLYIHTVDRLSHEARKKHFQERWSAGVQTRPI